MQQFGDRSTGSLKFQADDPRCPESKQMKCWFTWFI